MSKYKFFIFKDYVFNVDTKTLEFTYSYDDVLDFKEVFKFDFNFIDYSDAALEVAIQIVFFLVGVSYYKMYLAPEILVRKGQIDNDLAEFLSETYQKGLREFFYVNKLDPLSKVEFPVNSEPLSPVQASQSEGSLVGLGGGKDSLVSIELLRNQGKVASWSLNHKTQLEPLVKKVGLDHFWVERQIDPKVIELNAEDALNGHIPISAIFSSIGLVVATLSGYKDIVMSNENSSNEPSLVLDGVEINHQYSKSLEFEKSFQDLIKRLFNDQIRYYSLLRSMSEIRISEIFAKNYFDKYQNVFSSCNRAFRHSEDKIFWCGECSKCAFIYLVFSLFIDEPKLNKLWGGKNLLKDPGLEQTYRKLLGIASAKPLDCVGEIQESRYAMTKAQAKYPELNKYQFEMTDGYDYRALAANSLPSDINELMDRVLAQL